MSLNLGHHTFTLQIWLSWCFFCCVFREWRRGIVLQTMSCFFTFTSWDRKQFVLGFFRDSDPSVKLTLQNQTMSLYLLCCIHLYCIITPTTHFVQSQRIALVLCLPSNWVFHLKDSFFICSFILCLLFSCVFFCFPEVAAQHRGCC